MVAKFTIRQVSVAIFAFRNSIKIFNLKVLVKPPESIDLIAFENSLMIGFRIAL